MIGNSMDTIQTRNDIRKDFSDIVFINIPEGFDVSNQSLPIDKSKLLPVQLPEGSKQIDPVQGISMQTIAAAIIKLLAYREDHEDTPYYRQLLLAMQPDVAQELQIAAIAKAQKQDFEFAEELFLAANHLNPDIVEHYINLSVLYGQQAQLAKEASNEERYDTFIGRQLDILQKGLLRHPLSELLLAEIGMLNLYLGNEEIALEHLNAYLRIAQPSEKRDIIEAQVAQVSERLEEDSTLYAAFDEMQLGNHEQALRLVETFISRRPKAWEGYFIKGWALRVSEQFQKAADTFVTCLEAGGRNSDIYNELSLCMSALGNDELAKDYLEIALEMESGNITLLTNLAYLYLKDEQFNRVNELYQAAKELDPNDPLVKHLKEELVKRTGLTEDDDVIDI